jgi:hypothetical protein
MGGGVREQMLTRALASAMQEALEASGDGRAAENVAAGAARRARAAVASAAAPPAPQARGEQQRF